MLGYEALNRGPEEFAFQCARQIFEIATESNLIFELDRHRRRSALADARGIEFPVKVFINAIASSLNDPEFEPEKLSQRLKELDLTPEQIVIEMTQNLVLIIWIFLAQLWRNISGRASPSR